MSRAAAQVGSRYFFISDRWGNESLRVQFDQDDGAIEVVKVWDSASREWVLADLDNLPPITQSLIEDKIRQEMDRIAHERATGSLG